MHWHHGAFGEVHEEAGCFGELIKQSPQNCNGRRQARATNPPGAIGPSSTFSTTADRIDVYSVSKRSHKMGQEAQATMLGSTLVEFKVDNEHNKHLAIGNAVHSDAIAVGGHMWRMNCYPCGASIHPLWPSFRSFIFNNEEGEQVEQGWRQFRSQYGIESYHVTEGYITFVCAITVVSKNSIPVPPSDLGEHLARLLDSKDGTDVSFNVDGEMFHAHRAVLAARSPVFKVGLLGSMAEATMPSIPLNDIAPAVFRIILQFMYTDKLPGDDELRTSPFEMMQHLVAAADRYAMDRLKLICAQRLWANVSVDNVAAKLACAEMYSCSELKSKCIDFFAAEKNFKKSVLTEDFLQLGQNFPSIIVELRERVGT
ncbi:BTB/POZ and MATH domain-containing protein 1 [Setaria italica]|uniref:BTB/POZ and MATH domain-containing protein 1 n=1 Tax=Setaria italica TaxID=4555 RepID=UPI0006486D18|nr:BTB/POZ and MATH domain-containing protein 1 [Setaria italica]